MSPTIEELELVCLDMRHHVADEPVLRASSRLDALEWRRQTVWRWSSGLATMGTRRSRSSASSSATRVERSGNAAFERAYHPLWTREVCTRSPARTRP